MQFLSSSGIQLEIRVCLANSVVKYQTVIMHIGITDSQTDHANLTASIIIYLYYIILLL